MKEKALFSRKSSLKKPPKGSKGEQNTCQAINGANVAGVGREAEGPQKEGKWMRGNERHPPVCLDGGGGGEGARRGIHKCCGAAFLPLCNAAGAATQAPELGHHQRLEIWKAQPQCRRAAKEGGKRPHEVERLFAIGATHIKYLELSSASGKVTFLSIFFLLISQKKKKRVKTRFWGIS